MEGLAQYRENQSIPEKSERDYQSFIGATLGTYLANASGMPELYPWGTVPFGTLLITD